VKHIDYNRIEGRQVGEFKDYKHPGDSIHIVYDCELKNGATLHRFINGGGIECSAIYMNGRTHWWTYTAGDKDKNLPNEATMLRQWQQSK